ncbi:MAG: putative cupin superfamily sugar epimerase [Psychromonas sp.]|jgi:predicted cupin superfamily sugar epimerase
MFEAAYWIQKLALIPHPEGGFYRETYRSEDSLVLMVDGLEKRRHYATGIYFLMETSNFSAFHRIKSDELWHFYAGDPLEVFFIDDSGGLQRLLLGQNPENGEKLQALVPANLWFASRPLKNSRYSLVGCTVSPGFDFDDFEMAQSEVLTHKFPIHQVIIEELTRE